jgi:hypothetical protein
MTYNTKNIPFGNLDPVGLIAQSAPRIITFSPDTYGNTSAGITADPNTGVGYYNVSAGLVDQTTYGPISAGGWQTVDRPKQTVATQWFDRALYKLDLSIILDKTVTTPGSYSGISGIPDVENDCKQFELWMEPIPSILEPPTLQISGPVPGADRTWILYSMEMGEAVRDFSTGLRIQQTIKITLYEYNSPLATATHTANYSPAAAWTKNNNTVATTVKSLYTIKSGDTVYSIAGSQGAGYAQKILDANNLRDAALLAYMVGEVIILP